MAYYLDTFVEPESYYEEPENYYEEPENYENEEFVNLLGAAKLLGKGAAKVGKNVVTVGKTGMKGAGTVGKTLAKNSGKIKKVAIGAAAVTAVGYGAGKSGVLGEAGKKAAEKVEQGVVKGATAVGNVAVKGATAVGTVAVKGASAVGNVAGKGAESLSKKLLGVDLATMKTYIIMLIIFAIFAFISLPMYGLIGAAGFYGYNTFLKPKPQSNYYDNTEEFISLY
jgi:hypothetical protein